MTDLLDGVHAGLDRQTTSGELVALMPDEPYGTVRCLACAHRCRLRPGARGICRMRFNHAGTLRVPYGYASSVACDPIEKKPFFHFLPGQDALSIGMLGCNFHCAFCQNWNISQTLRDPDACTMTRRCSAEELIATASRLGAPVVTSTYNEPLVTSEWAAKVFKLAKAQGMMTAYVSNGFASEEALAYLDPWLDAMNVDLKCFTDKGYRWLGGRLQPVLDTISALWCSGKWVEVITLVVPGFNDSDTELRQIAEFLASVSADIPWHVSAYHADYRMRDAVPRTPVARLESAIRIGKECGLRYVYAGNVRRAVASEDTICPSCGTLLIERAGFSVRRHLLQDGVCPSCGTAIAGRWTVPSLSL